MEREHRYYVAKKKDVEKYLSEGQQLQFDRLLTKIRLGRLGDGKADVQTVCVGSDWPEYETVWKMIEDRVDSRSSPASAPEGWKLPDAMKYTPMRPDESSHEQVDRYHYANGWNACREAMLSAAPTPPVQDDRKDAERYRWLRSSSVGPSQIWELLSDDCQPPIMTLKSMHDLDAAIDAAMAKGGEK